MTRHFRLKHKALYRKILPFIRKRQVSGVNKSVKKNSFWVKKYSTEIDRNKYQCDLCKSIMKMPKAHMGNMKRHIRAKHPEVYESEVKGVGNQKREDTDDVNQKTIAEYLKEFMFEEQTVAPEDDSKAIEPELETYGSPVPEAIAYQDVTDVEPALDASQLDEIEYISETDPESEKKIKWLALRSVPGKRNSLSCVWSFFKPVEPNHTYNCIFCRKTISIFPYSCHNLKRHLKIRHNDQYKLITKYRPERKIRLSKLLENTDDDMSETLKTSYFEVLEDGRYKCIICDVIITAQAPDSLVLFKHIYDKHDNQPIDRLEDDGDDDEEYSVLVVKKKDLELLSTS